VRYPHDKQQSAEILRLAVPLMARQEASFHPTSYALWYEYVAGTNPPLTSALEARLSTGAPLTEAEVTRLYVQYIAARDAEVLERVQRELRALIDDTARNAASAGAQAASFRQVLEGQAEQLSQPVDPAGVQRIVDDLLADTQRMHVVTGELTGVLTARAREVEELRERLEVAQSEALLDPLTGIKNRRGFDRAIEKLCEHDTGLAGSALLVADVDRFKLINDSFGHLFGDKVLCAVAHVLQLNTKGRDIAARLGGDEFAILLPDTQLAHAATLAGKIRVLVSHGRIRRNDRSECVGQVTISLGVAAAEAGDTMEALLERADKALYAAKRAGRNRVSVAGETMFCPTG
jgi:diguanylate cyclase